MTKRERQTVIRELIATRPVGSQEELRQLLAERGWDVTQSTLSRDMRDLRIARIPTPTGIRYTVPDATAASEEGRATLASIFPQLFARLASVPRAFALFLELEVARDAGLAAAAGLIALAVAGPVAAMPSVAHSSR